MSCLFAAGEQQHVLELLARRRCHNIQPAFGLIFRIGEPQEAGLSALEEARKDLREVFVDARKRLVELGPRNLIDLLDRFHRVVDRLDQVGALHFEEAMPLGCLLIFVERHHVHRANLLQPLAQCAAGFFFQCQRFIQQALDHLIGSSSAVASRFTSVRQLASRCSRSDFSFAAALEQAARSSRS